MLSLFTKKDKRSVLEKEIEDLVGKMKDMDRTSEEYHKASEDLDRLCKAASYTPKQKINPNTLLMIGANCAIAIFIAFREEITPITTKPLQFLFKGRV